MGQPQSMGELWASEPLASEDKETVGLWGRSGILPEVHHCLNEATWSWFI